MDSVHFSHVQLFATPWTAARQASLSITNSWSLLKLTSIESVMPSNHLILCHPLILLPSIFPSIRVFSNESAVRIRGPKYWNFSFSISPSNEYSELISFRIDWFDLLAVQGTLNSSLPLSGRTRIQTCVFGSLAQKVLFLGHVSGAEDPGDLLASRPQIQLAVPQHFTGRDKWEEQFHSSLGLCWAVPSLFTRNTKP